MLTSGLISDLALENGMPGALQLLLPHPWNINWGCTSPKLVFTHPGHANELLRACLVSKGFKGREPGKNKQSISQSCLESIPLMVSCAGKEMKQHRGITPHQTRPIYRVIKGLTWLLIQPSFSLNARTAPAWAGAAGDGTQRLQ